MKQAQVAPRTIHFHETVQIKEIEPNEETNRTPTTNLDEAAWDPNITDVRVLVFSSSFHFCD